MPAAVESQCDRDQRQPRPKRRDADRDEADRGELGPDRMMIAGDRHLDRAGRHLRWANESAETNRRRQRHATRLQNRQEVDRQKG